MVTFEHLEKTETISAHGDKTETDWDAPLMGETTNFPPHSLLERSGLNSANTHKSEHSG